MQREYCIVYNQWLNILDNLQFGNILSATCPFRAFNRTCQTTCNSAYSGMIMRVRACSNNTPHCCSEKSLAAAFLYIESLMEMLVYILHCSFPFAIDQNIWFPLGFWDPNGCRAGHVSSRQWNEYRECVCKNGHIFTLRMVKMSA